MENNTHEYMVRHTRRESPTTVTLKLSLKKGDIPVHIPGQFINVYFPEFDTPEGKAYSISSVPNGTDFAITVRGIGRFSNRLCALAVGDTVHASFPYGFFYPEHEESDIVLIASGIGITPFRSIIGHAAKINSLRKIVLFHTVRTHEDTFFKNEFEVYRSEDLLLSLNYFVTQEKTMFKDVIARRMTADDILKNSVDLHNPEFLICGSISFTGDMWKTLKQKGVPQDSLYTEAFFSH